MIQMILTLDNKTEDQYRQSNKNTENIKHTVKQARQKNERATYAVIQKCPVFFKQ